MKLAVFTSYQLISETNILDFLGSEWFDIYREWLRHNMRTERILINDVWHDSYDHFLEFMKHEKLPFSYSINSNM